MSCAQQQFTANTGLCKVSVANSNRDGSGTVATLINGSDAGTFINSITIKAEGSTSQGMIRFFMDNGGTKTLLMEVVVPATTPTGIVETFGYTFATTYNISASSSILVSTEVAEVFHVFADGMTMINCNC